MGRLHRLIVAVALSVLAAGALAALGHATRHSPHRRATAPPSRPAPTAGPATTTARAPTTTAPRAPTTVAVPPGEPGPPDSVLQGDLITPTDMGGYYRVVAADGAALLASDPCLAALGRAPGSSGRAVTALLGPDARSLPAIVEAVSSYPDVPVGAAPAATSPARDAFTAAAGTLSRCSVMSFSFGGATATTHLAPLAMEPVGDDVRAWSGDFGLDGGDLQVQVGLVLDGSDLLCVVWIDSVPPADAIMGGFVSTLSLAIGKLA